MKLQAQRSGGDTFTKTTQAGSVGVTIRHITEPSEGGSGGGSGLEFVQGGNAFGSRAILGTTDSQGLDIITDGATALSFSSSGSASFTQGLTIQSGGLDVSGDSTMSGTLSGLSGLTMSSGGIDVGSFGIENAGSITGVGSDILASNGLTIASGNNSNLELSSASGVLLIDASTWRRTASGNTTIELNDGSDTTLTITNTGAGDANLVVDGVVSASDFSGGGAGLTGLSATNIASGTLEDERLSSNIARLDESQTFSGLTSFSSGLTLGNTATTAAGTLRWTGADFEGYDGSEWVSLTGGGSGQGGYASSRLTTSFSGNINQATETVIEWDAQNSIDSPPFDHSTAANPGRLTITEDGTYRIYANLSFTSTIVRANPKMQCRLNGSILLDGTSAGGYIRSASGHNTASTNLTIVEELEAGDYIEVVSSQDANSGLVTLLLGESVFIVETAIAGTAGGSSGSGSGLEFTQGGNAFGSTALL